MVDIVKFKYYFRWYPFECSNNLPLWMFDKQTGKVLSKKDADILASKGKAEHVLLPLPLVDIVEMEKEFLTTCGYEKEKNKMQKDMQKDFDCLFKCFIDYNGLTQAWHVFEGEKLQACAINWCKANGVRFIVE